jgi:hypothetical protein
VQQNGTGLFGWVDADHSPLYPLHAAVSGSVFAVTGGQDAVSFGFDVQGPKGTDLNPAYPKDVVRHFTFTGTRTDGSTLTGTFTETFDGILDAARTQLSGDAVFTRSGPMADGMLDPAPAVTLTLAGNPFVDGTGALTSPYKECATCPRSGGCSASPTENVAAFLQATDGSGNPKLAFYNAFWQAWNNPSLNPQGPFKSINDCVSKSACASPYDPQSLRCAQYWAWKGLSSDGTVYGQELVDALEPSTDYGLYLGDAQTAAAMDAWYNPGSSLDQQINLLALAEDDFIGGLHSVDQTAPMALLDPFFASVLAKLERRRGPATRS